MPRWFVELLPPWLCVALGVGLVASARGPLLRDYQQPTEHEQISLLLSPEYSVVFSLGHRAALADYLFANLLVHYGLSFREKTRYEATYRYLDTITTLAPNFVRPYLYADTLLTMRPTPAVLEDYLDTRRLHERGLEALPSHTELWLVAGQFAAYLAPQRVPDPYAKELRLKGARDLARACELASDNANIPYGCIAAARLLNREGQREAMIRMLSRTLAVNDDPEIRKMALGYLEQAVNERERDRYGRRVQALEAVWKQQAPQVSRVMMSLLGPGPEVWKCAGLAAALAPGCETTWRDWTEVKAGFPGNGR
jgi:hypothetical protein